jgi:hypothetical protein
MTDEETSTRMPSPEAAAAAAAEMEGYKEQDVERQERGAPETKAPAQTTKEDCAKDCEADTPKTGLSGDSAVDPATPDPHALNPNDDEYANDNDKDWELLLCAPPAPIVKSSSTEEPSKRAPSPPPVAEDGKAKKSDLDSSNIAPHPPEEASTPPPMASAALMTSCHHYSSLWSRMIHGVRIHFCHAIKVWSHWAACHPWTTIVTTIVLSLTLIVIGLATNFQVEVDGDKLWPPNNSLSRQHHAWILDESGFPLKPNNFYIVVHRNGGNVLGYEGIIRSFEVVDAMRSHPDYGPVCQEYVYGFNYGLEKSERTCPIHGIIDFWDEDVTVFKDEVQTDEEAIQAMSSMEYSNGLPVDENAVFGNVERYDNGTLKSAEGFLFRLDFPPTEEAEKLELELLDQLLELQEEWTADPSNGFQFHPIGKQSVDEELNRAIVKDIPLMPIAFLVMSIFNFIVYSKRDRVKSQGLLGIGAVVAVLLAIISGYGILFTIGMHIM